MSTLKKEVVAWLESADRKYHDGIFLASQCLVNKALVFNLGKKENVNNFDKLVNELSKFAGVPYKPVEGVARAAYVAPLEVAPVEEETTVEFAVNDEVRSILDQNLLPTDPGFESVEHGRLREERNAMLETLPVDVRDLFLAKDQAYNRRNLVSQQLQDLGDNPDPEQTKSLTEEALAIDEEIKALDTQIQYFYRNGTIAPKGEPVQKKAKPELSAEVKAELESLGKAIANKRSEISRQTKKVNANPENVEYQESLARMNAQLKELVFKRDTLKGVAV